jgi:hypothetical protein
MSQPPPTLLTLPPEIRHQILYYSLLVPMPMDTFSIAIISVSQRLRYGSAHISSLFVVCRLLHAELEHILFTRFVFAFAPYLPLAAVRDFTSSISSRARMLLREVMMVIDLDLECDETEAVVQKMSAEKLVPTKEVLGHLKRELRGLFSVHLHIGFSRGPLSGVLVQRRVDELADVIMGLVTMLAPEIRVIVSNVSSCKYKKDILSVCRRKAEELMVNFEEEDVGV